MKNITLIVTGGVAAIKSEKLYGLLAKKYNMKVIFTTNGKRFVSDEFAQAHQEQLFKKPKYIKGDDSPHVALAKWSDAVIVYPATQNFIAKIANGFSNDLPSLLISAFRKPILVFEAMNEAMLENPIYCKNKETLNNLSNFKVYDAKYGKLANGDLGWGRVWEAEDVAKELELVTTDFSNLQNKKVLINLGRTRQAIDSVRYISNGSSGKLGKALIDTAKIFTNNYYGFFGDNDLGLKETQHLTYCNTNDDMLQAIKKEFGDADVFIASAALTDFVVTNKSDKKISKQENENPTIELSPNIDVLKELGSIKKNQFLVGFSLLDSDDLAVGYQKMKAKNCDMMVVNSASNMGSEDMSARIINRFDSDVKVIDSVSKVKFSFELFKVISKYIENFSL